MSKNPYGAISRSNAEWGSKARKEEDRIRGMRTRAKREVIAESAADEIDNEDEVSK